MSRSYRLTKTQIAPHISGGKSLDESVWHGDERIIPKCRFSVQRQRNRYESSVAKRGQNHLRQRMASRRKARRGGEK